jgi:SAM-dependent methyltransferase
MDMFPDGTFDFVLFSYNGLDYLSPQDRLMALAEIKRVGKKGAYFLFSSHNLNIVDRIFNDRLIEFQSRRSRNPRKLVGSLASLWRLAVLYVLNGNPRALKARDFAVINDGMGRYHTRISWLLLSLMRHMGYNYFIKPHAQVRQLRSLGFHHIQVFADDGREIADEAELAALPDAWVHYSCRI